MGTLIWSYPAITDVEDVEIQVLTDIYKSEEWDKRAGYHMEITVLTSIIGDCEPMEHQYEYRSVDYDRPSYTKALLDECMVKFLYDMLDVAEDIRNDFCAEKYMLARTNFLSIYPEIVNNIVKQFKDDFSKQ